MLILTVFVSVLEASINTMRGLMVEAILFRADVRRELGASCFESSLVSEGL
jgi:hypothetical protein